MTAAYICNKCKKAKLIQETVKVHYKDKLQSEETYTYWCDSCF